jgi:hypothetical protein
LRAAWRLYAGWIGDATVMLVLAFPPLIPTAPEIGE